MHTKCLAPECSFLQALPPNKPCPHNRGTSVANDLHLYDVNIGEWMTPRVTPPPSSRFAHAACAWGEKSLLVFGGVSPGEDLADVALLTYS